MKALTIKQPWATLLFAGKDIENRDWPTKYRGIVAVHSSKRIEQAEVRIASALMRGFIPKFSERIFTAEVAKSPERYPLGSIIGTVEIVDSCLRCANNGD